MWVARSENEEYPEHVTISLVYPFNAGSAKRAAEPDAHGDVVDMETLQRAAWSWMEKRPKVGLMHLPGTEGAGEVLESWIHRGPDWNVKDTSGETQVVREGDWLCAIRWQPEAWAAILRGEITGLSLQGQARHAKEVETSTKSRRGEQERYVMRRIPAIKKDGSVSFRDVVFNEQLVALEKADDAVREFPLEVQEEREPEQMSDEEYVTYLNEQMQRALEGHADNEANRHEVREPGMVDAGEANWRREGDGVSLPVNTGRSKPGAGVTPYRLEEEGAEPEDVTDEESETFMRPGTKSPQAESSRPNWPQASERGVRKSKVSFESVIFGPERNPAN